MLLDNAGSFQVGQEDCSEADGPVLPFPENWAKIRAELGAVGVDEAALGLIDATVALRLPAAGETGEGRVARFGKFAEADAAQRHAADLAWKALEAAPSADTPATEARRWALGRLPLFE